MFTSVKYPRNNSQLSSRVLLGAHAAVSDLTVPHVGEKIVSWDPTTLENS